MLFKKFVSAVVVFSFLYGNCIYAIPQNSANHQTLTNASELLNPAFKSNIQNLAHISNLLEKKQITENDLGLFKVMFGKLLGVDYEEITVAYNRDLKELFLYSNKKDYIVHIYINGHTDLGAPIESPYNKVAIYSYSEERIGRINRIKDIELPALPRLSEEEIQQIAIEQIKNILTEAGVSFTEEQTPEELVALYNGNQATKDFLNELLKLIPKKQADTDSLRAEIPDIKEALEVEKEVEDSYAMRAAPLFEEYGLALWSKEARVKNTITKIMQSNDININELPRSKLRGIYFFLQS